MKFIKTKASSSLIDTRFRKRKNVYAPHFLIKSIEKKTLYMNRKKKQTIPMMFNKIFQDIKKYNDEHIKGKSGLKFQK